MPTRRESILLTTLLAAGALLPAPRPARAAPALPGLRPLAANPAGAFDALYAVELDADGHPLLARTPLSPRLDRDTVRRVRLMHFNDLHNALSVPHAVRGDTHAFAQMVRHVRAARAAAGDDEIVLFTSSGDDQTGGVLDELLGFTPAEMIVHPAYHAYAAAGVDAVALGNHEFDRGTAMLRLALSRNPDVVALSANVDGGSAFAGAPLFHPATLGLVKGLRVGMIGLTTAEDTRTGTPENPGLAVTSPLDTLRRLLPALAESSDVVLLLSHLGYGSGEDRSGKSGAERRIGEGDAAVARLAAELTDRPVVILGAHTHTVLNADGLESRNLVAGRVMITQAGAQGSHLGEAVVTVAGGGGLRDMTARLIGLKKADRRVPAGDPKAATLQQDGDVDLAFQGLVMAPVLARLDRRLGEVIGSVDADQEVTTEATVARRYVGETAIANLMNDLMLTRSAAAFPDGAADVAVFNATGLVAGVPARGPITFSDWFAVMPFTDSVIVATMTGAEIQAMLDSNAQRLVRPEELTGANPVDLKGYVSRGLLHFSSSLRYRVALGRSAAEARAVEATLAGRPLAQLANRSFRVLFGSYVGNGAFAEAWNGREIAGLGGLRGFDLTALPRRDTGFVYRNEVVAQIRARGTLTAADGARLDGRLVVGA
jgi:2',3'-cyclic-nucleotide 2'-phosphodiesterase (5'-nucleotidase family)